MQAPLAYSLGPLGRGRGGAGPWWLQGGISAAAAVAAYQPKGAVSQAASYTNRAVPGTNTAAPGTAPTWATGTGWTFASAGSQYLTTGIQPGAAWSVLVRFSGANTTGDEWLLGLYTDGGWGLQASTPFGTGAWRTAYYNGPALNPNAAQSSGVLGLAGPTAYLNGASAGTLGAGSFTTTDLYLGNVHYSGGTRYLTGSIQAIAIYNTTLTAPQMAAVTSAMQAL